MDALRQYSHSDEEVGSGTPPVVISRPEKSSISQEKHHRHQSRKSNSSSPDRSFTHRQNSPKRRSPPSRKRSRSPHSSRRYSPPSRRRSRSPQGRRRSRSPIGHSRREHYSGSTRQRCHGDRRRSPPPPSSSHHNEYKRHRQRSRSPPKRHDSEGSIHHDEEGKPLKSDQKKTDKPKTQEPEQKPVEKPQWSTDSSLTPEQKLEQALNASRALKQQTIAATNVARGLPSYINPAVINPKQFKEIQQKRKLLWGGKAKEKQTKQSWNKWESASFEGDSKGETQMKFRRLMGIKDDGGDATGTGKESLSNQDVEKKKTNKLLDDLEAQYESSRFMTHLAKGAGLGYGQAAQITQTKVDPNDTDDINETNR